MNTIRLNSNRQFNRHVTANWLGRIEPNLAMTMTLKQRISTFNGKDLAWVQGDEVQYGKAFIQLVRRLSKQAFPHAYRRHGKLIPGFASLEGDGQTKRLHLHGAIRCPDHIDPVDMDKMIRDQWQHCEWAMPDVKIEPIVGPWVNYILKDGTEALLVETISF